MLNQLFNSKERQKFLLRLIVFLFFSSSIHVLQAQTNTQSSLTARLVNIEAPTNETFRYNGVLSNANSLRHYNLSANLPAGWQITYRVEGVAVTSLQMDPNTTKDISFEITCPIATKPGTYKIPVSAIASSDTLKIDLEAVVKGSYAVELTTPSGRLSDEIVAGSSKEILLVVKNTGTLPLNNLELSSQLPSKWETSFSPSTIEQLHLGQQADVKVTLKVPEKTIAGDYVTKMTVRASANSSEAAIRIMVKTSLLSGWIGLVIILASVGLIYLLIRKYGRR